MPTFHIVRESKILESFRVAQVRGMFDYQNPIIRHEWKSSTPIETMNWTIGVIVGPSGSGKTTLAREAFTEIPFHNGFEWRDNCAILDNFDEDKDTKDIVKALNSVGFSSPPHWLKPFAHLSNGQKFRAELARCILENEKGTVFDEFTSVVDRDVAKIGCAAVSKAIRANDDKKKFVAVSCHYDIIDWLDPDWVFDVGTQKFTGRCRRRFPEIKLDIFQSATSAWAAFREHHYLDHQIHKAAQCFVAIWQGKPVGFCSVLHFPHAQVANFKREHRTVILPDFQGVGIGNRLSEFVASHYKSRGFRFISTTSAPSMIMHRSRSNNWRCHRFGNAAKATKTQTTHKGSSSKRKSGGFEYIGL